MQILEFNEELIRKVYKNKKILIINDLRKTSFCDDNNTKECILAEKLNLDLYPLCIDLNILILRVLLKNYGDFDYWFVNKELYFLLTS
jgi:hypothetical protein